MRFDKMKLNLNVGRLLAHEIGHALGANHDDGEETQMKHIHLLIFLPDFDECRNGNHLMTSVISDR